MKKIFYSFLMFFSLLLVTATIVVLALYKAGYHPATEQGLEVQRGNWVSEDLPLRPQKENKVFFLNINHGLGREPIWYEVEGAGRKTYDAGKIMGNLEKVTQLATEAGTDVLMLQEVDFASEATNMQDQAEYLATRLGFAYVARVSDQRSPFPFYPDPLKLEFAGPIDTGFAVISRYPIITSVQNPLPKAKKRHWTLDAFGPISYIYEARIKVDEARLLKLIHVRLDELSPEARQGQAYEAAVWIDRRDYHDSVAFVSAYTEPPVRPKTREEALSQKDVEYTIDLLRHRRHMIDVVPDYEFFNNKEKWLNVLGKDGKPAYFWDRVMVGPSIKEPRLQILQDKYGTSDHLPLVMEFLLPES